MIANRVASLRSGPLGSAGGVAVFDGLPDAEMCAALAAEAYAVYPSSNRQDLDRDDRSEGRGGIPPRAMQIATGGPVQEALYAEPWLRTFLAAQCGTRIVPSANQGSYSYYVRPGDFLGTHLDVDSCDVTLITVLYDDTNPRDPAGGLAVYPDAIGMPLGLVRAAPDAGVALIKAWPGQSIVLLGGLVPHCVVPLGPEGQRVISALCFRAAR